MLRGFWRDSRKIARVILVGSLLLSAFLVLVNFLSLGSLDHRSYAGSLLLLTIVMFPMSLLFYVVGILLYVFYASQAFDEGVHFEQTAKLGWLVSLLYNLVGFILLLLQIIHYFVEYISGGLSFATLFGYILDGMLFAWFAAASALSAAAFVARKPRYKWST
ncbi:MAG: hypothetical protein AAF267_22660 [Deinococcota bacterium]